MSIDLSLPSWLVDISCLCLLGFTFGCSSLPFGDLKILLAYLFVLVLLLTYRILPYFLLEHKV